MASRLICGSLLLLVVCCVWSSPLLKRDYSCENNEKCEGVCGVGQGWCLGGWCACARKRDVGPQQCQDVAECSDWECPALKSPRCLWNRCLCLEDFDLGR